MSKIASQITSLTIVYSTVYSDPDQTKHQSSASLAFVREIHGEFPAQMASNAENVSIWWRHHVARFHYLLRRRTHLKKENMPSGVFSWIHYLRKIIDQIALPVPREALKRLVVIICSFIWKNP